MFNAYLKKEIRNKISLNNFLRVKRFHFNLNPNLNLN